MKRIVCLLLILGMTSMAIAEEVVRKTKFRWKILEHEAECAHLTPASQFYDCETRDANNDVLTFFIGNKQIARQVSDLFGNITEEEGQIPDGVIKEYYDTGELADEMNYKDNRLNGVAKTYYRTGVLFYEVNYQDGKRDGVQKVFYESGKLKNEFHRKDGMFEGSFTTYYESGVTESEGNYKNHEYDGLIRDYDENGTLKREFLFKDGRQVSIIKR